MHIMNKVLLLNYGSVPKKCNGRCWSSYFQIFDGMLIKMIRVCFGGFDGSNRDQPTTARKALLHRL